MVFFSHRFFFFSNGSFFQNDFVEVFFFYLFLVFLFFSKMFFLPFFNGDFCYKRIRFQKNFSFQRFLF